MVTYQQYYEAFSLDPRDWFKSKIEQNNHELRAEARAHYMTSIKKLKDFLTKENYKIIKADNGAYTIRSRREVGLESPQRIGGNRDADVYKKDPVLSIPYMRTLFVLAHETGHVMQWNPDGSDDPKVKFTEFFNDNWAVRDTPEEKTLKHIQQLWYELHAWVEGMQFIPVKYKAQYKKFAYDSYKTYMDKLPKHYHPEMLLRNLMYQLNFDEQ